MLMNFVKQLIDLLNHTEVMKLYYWEISTYSMSQLDMQVGYSLISEKIKVTNPGPNYYLSFISRYK